MEGSKSHQSKIEDDILFHLEQISIDLSRLKLDYSRDSALQYYIENLNKKIELITGLYLRNDKPIYRALKNKINSLVKLNPNLNSINVIIRNTRCENPNGKSEKFYLEI